MPSIWKQTVEMESRPPLDSDLHVEVAVIGAGMAGTLTAYMLRQRGVDCAVFEAAQIGSGQTNGTTAKITSQHGLIYANLIEQFGQERARQYAEANQRAIAHYRQIADENGVDCMMEERDAFIYDLHDSSGLRREAEAAASLGLPAAFVNTVQLPFSVAGAVRFAHQAQFHPLRFLKGISRGLTIYEHSPVASVEGNTLHINGHTVTADKIVFATHFPFVNFPGLYFARMYQSRSYTIALENAAHADGMFDGAAEGDLSLRGVGRVLLLCGETHRTGENSKGGRYGALRRIAAALYPGSREIARWSAQDCMTPDAVPYIGQYAPDMPDWYVATGFNKWGMSSSMVAAELLTDRILGIDNPNAEVFSPQRFNTATMAEVLREGGQAIKGLGLQHLTVPETAVKDLPIGHGGVVNIDGEKAGVYRDDAGVLHAVSTRCAHMGCQVEWNPDEKSWDCPCHGSRYDMHGHLIDNPAQEDLPPAEIAGLDPNTATPPTAPRAPQEE